MTIRKRSKSRPKTARRWLMIWWAQDQPYTAIYENKDAAEGGAAFRNAVLIEICKDAGILAVDWYFRDEAGRPMPFIWHRYENVPKKWKAKYVILWWADGNGETGEAKLPNHTVVYDPTVAYLLAAKFAGVVVEIMLKPVVKVGEVLDYRLWNRDGIPMRGSWRGT
mgnify:CR=1 FL=1